MGVMPISFWAMSFVFATRAAAHKRGGDDRPAQAFPAVDRSDTGRWSIRPALVDEEQGLCRELVDAGATGLRPLLAQLTGVLAVSLRAAGRRAEALDAAGEAVDLDLDQDRELSAGNREAFLPNLDFPRERQPTTSVHMQPTARHDLQL